MQYIEKLWNNFKNQPDVWFFYGFILTFTLTIRKVLFFYPIQESFNEYTGIYLYLSDIFLFLTIFTWILSFILYNNISYLSIYKNLLSKKFYIPLLLVIWCFISILWSDNTSIAFFRSIKILELYLLYIYLAFNVIFHPVKSKNVPRGTFLDNGAGMEQFDSLQGVKLLRNLLLLVAFIGSIQGLIGIVQFLFQHSIGLSFLWESFVSRGTIGVAKIILNGKPYIRAYGLFPHPNMLGGFLLLSLISTFFLKKLLYACPADCSTWNNPTGMKQFNWNKTLKITRIINIFLTIQIIAIILTFSKSSLIGLLLALIYVFYNRNCSKLALKNVPRGTFLIVCNNFISHNRLKIITKRSILIILILIFSVIVFKPDFYSFLIKPLNERLVFQNVSRGTILANPLLGVGIGQFVLTMDNYFSKNLELWQYQPVHNIFLLIWSELGIIGLGLFLWFLWTSFKANKTIDASSCKEKNCSTWNNFVSRGTIIKQDEFNIYLKGALIGFIFIMLFDHYLWDIQQGQLILWITLGLLASEE